MRKLLFLPLLILSSLAIAQHDSYEQAFLSNIPKDLGKAIHVPDPGRLGYYDIFSIAPYDSKIRMLVISSDSLYKKIFSRFTYTKEMLENYRGDKTDGQYRDMIAHLKDSVPVVDFTRYELVIYSACGQCLANCDHSRENAACHRNVCEFSFAWFIRERSAEKDRASTRIM